MENWDDKFDYLKLTRSLYLNIDYLQFLIEKVWKITKKVDVIDFGCGYGYLGLVLMSLLPNGSSYTGVDISEKLINKGKEIFKELPFNHKFILSSVNNVPEKDDTFDIAICNSVLMHIPEPDAVLAEMKRITKNDGMIITCESNWNAVNALLYIDGIKKSKITDLGFLQILFERIHEKTKTDGNIGMKMPVIMARNNIKNIQARISDSVRIILADEKKEDQDSIYTSLQSDGFGEELSDEQKSKKINWFMELGFSEEEATKYLEKEIKLNEIFRNRDELNLVYAAAMTFCFGYVRK
ncbi:Methyltransferase domain-containing protein [Treponema bryantii]|uniref:Methyltransferase domain-containing protein n=1 Tax=Treponema bryantii TaxID=163 RepID=A0A1I3J795_9SPIR|nr:class I SAM-dependent methyltransferase [Treponema bryantii]SFI56030.1 Methyltransferase domain-containing protein [Treponema bryantii]